MIDNNAPIHTTVQIIGISEAVGIKDILFRMPALSDSPVGQPVSAWRKGAITIKVPPHLALSTINLEVESVIAPVMRENIMEINDFFYTLDHNSYPLYVTQPALVRLNDAVVMIELDAMLSHTMNHDFQNHHNSRNGMWQNGAVMFLLYY